MTLALDAMKVPVIRQTVAMRPPRSRAAGRCTPGTTCWASSPVFSGSRPATRTRQAGARSQRFTGRAGRRSTPSILGSPSRSAARRRPRGAARLRRSTQYRDVDAISDARVYAHVGLPYGKNPLALVARSSPLMAARVGCRCSERVVAPHTISLPVPAGQVIGNVQVWSGTRWSGSARSSPHAPSRGLA